MEFLKYDTEICNNVNDVENRLSNAKKDTAILKVIKSYKDDAVDDTTNYIASHPIDNGIFGIGLFGGIEDIAGQFNMVKSLYDRKSEINARHYMIGLSYCDWIDDSNIRAISFEMALFFWQIGGFQTFYGIHQKDDRYHIHIIVNAYSITSNYKLPISKDLKIDYLNYLRNLNFQGRTLKVYEANGYY